MGTYMGKKTGLLAMLLALIVLPLSIIASLTKRYR
jgi:hypothetical protein